MGRSAIGLDSLLVDQALKVYSTASKRPAGESARWVGTACPAVLAKEDMDPPGVIRNGKVFMGCRGKRAAAGVVRTILFLVDQTSKEYSAWQGKGAWCGTLRERWDLNPQVVSPHGGISPAP
jgi:hypothetical protein